jgi:hypothetical protein
MAAGAGAGFVQNTAARLAKFVQRFGKIFDAQSNVVQARTAFLNKLGDGGIGASGFEKFDARGIGLIASGKHGDADLFDGNGFGMADGHAESLGIELKAFGEAADSDSEMIDFNGHGDSSQER